MVANFSLVCAVFGLAFSPSALALLNGTMEECEAAYGPALATKDPVEDQPNTKMALYAKNGLMIYALFQGEKARTLKIRKIEETTSGAPVEMSDTEIQSFLKANSEEQRWDAVNSSYADVKTWVLQDWSAYAGYDSRDQILMLVSDDPSRSELKRWQTPLRADEPDLPAHMGNSEFNFEQFAPEDVPEPEPDADGPSAAQPLVKIETVEVGDPGNAADTTGHGAVPYEYSIGKYEVTIGQYATFLNSVAAVTSGNHIVNLWNERMATDLNVAGISRSGSGTVDSPYSYAVIGSGNRPIAHVSWFDAARFANWMNNGATNGASTETGAYALNGATNGVGFAKNAGATWWIPSEDEWYKAAYYKGGGTNAGYWDYPTQTDADPFEPGNSIGGTANQANIVVEDVYAVTQSSSYNNSQNYLTDVGAFSNSASAYGTFDQAGNVGEWNDAVLNDSCRIMRGGSYQGGIGVLLSVYRFDVDPSHEFCDLGFRLASVPEP